MSGLSLLDSSNASVWPCLPSSAELTPPAVSASGLEDVCSSSGSHERGGEGPAPLGGTLGCGKGGPESLSRLEAGLWGRAATSRRSYAGAPPSRQHGGRELGVSGVTAPGHTGPSSVGLLSSTLFVSGEATWSGSEFEVSFPDSPGAQAQPDHLPQLTLPDSLTSAASPEDGLSAELLEAQAEEEPASPESPDCGVEAGGAPSQARLSTPEHHSGL